MATKISVSQLDKVVVVGANLDQRYLTFTNSDGSETKIDLLVTPLVVQTLPVYTTIGSQMELRVTGGVAGTTFTITESKGTGLSSITLANKILGVDGSYSSVFTLNNNFSLGLHEWQLVFSTGDYVFVPFLAYQGAVVPVPPATIDDEVRLLDQGAANRYNNVDQKWHVDVPMSTTLQFRKLGAYGPVNTINVTKTSGPQHTLYEGTYQVAPGTDQTTPRSVNIPNDSAYAGTYDYTVSYKDITNAELRSYPMSVVVEAQVADPWAAAKFTLTQGGTNTVSNIVDGQQVVMALAAGNPFTNQISLAYGLKKIVVTHSSGLGGTPTTQTIEGEYIVQMSGGVNTGLTTSIQRTLSNQPANIGDYYYTYDMIDEQDQSVQTGTIKVVVSDPSGSGGQDGPWDNMKFRVTRSGGDLNNASIISYFNNVPGQGPVSPVFPIAYVGESVKGQWYNIDGIQRVVCVKTGGPSQVFWEGQHQIDQIQDISAEIGTTGVTTPYVGTMAYRMELYNTGNVKVRQPLFEIQFKENPKNVGKIRIVKNGVPTDIALNGGTFVQFTEGQGGTYQFVNLEGCDSVQISRVDNYPPVGAGVQNGTVNLNAGQSPTLNLNPVSSLNTGTWDATYEVRIVYDLGSLISVGSFKIRYTK